MNIRNIILTGLTLIALCNVTISCSRTQTGNVELSTHNDTMNWVIGESMAQSMMASGLEIDKKMILKAIEATFNGEKQPINDSTYNEVLADLNFAIMNNQREQQKKNMADASAVEDEYFKKLLAANPNIKKSDKGFYYEVLKEGTGKIAKKGDVVVFDYKASLINGQVFDQTYGNRDAITHVVGNPMFQGMQEGLCLMNAGATFRFYFPYQLAFGTEGTPDIPPYSTVIYEIELHKLK